MIVCSATTSMPASAKMGRASSLWVCPKASPAINQPTLVTPSSVKNLAKLESVRDPASDVVNM